MTNEYDLVSPSDDHAWRCYHDLRREVRFEARGRFACTTNIVRTSERLDITPNSLCIAGTAVAVVRIDISGADAILRRVAVRSDVQRRLFSALLLRACPGSDPGQTGVRPGSERGQTRVGGGSERDQSSQLGPDRDRFLCHPVDAEAHGRRREPPLVPDDAFTDSPSDTAPIHGFTL